MGKRMKLAVLPVESDQFPRVAAGINGVFQDVRMSGIDDYFLSKVTLEVVQLSVECVEPTSACYAVVGHSLGAQRLLMAHISAEKAQDRGRHRRRQQPLKVSVTLFDVDAETPANVVDKVFKNEDEATQALADLVKQATTPTAMTRVSP
jgi:hypothetical protein